VSIVVTQPQTPQDTVPVNPLVESIGPSPVREIPLTSQELLLSGAVLLMGAIVLTLLFLLVRTRRVPADAILRTITVPLVVISALFMVTAGYSTSDVAPVIGLLGTIVGYLLGDRRTAPANAAENGAKGE
jgi:hypothetical protein